MFRMKIPGKMDMKKVSETLINQLEILALLTTCLFVQSPTHYKHFLAMEKVFCLFFVFLRGRGGGGVGQRP